MKTKIIGGVTFNAMRKAGPRGAYWVAVIAETNKELPQHYVSKPKLWDDLETCYRLSNAKQWESML